MTRNFICILLNCILVVLSDAENAMYGNHILNCYVVKRILISFNCFSEYINIIFKRMILNHPNNISASL